MSKIILDNKALKFLSLYLENYLVSYHGRSIANKMNMNQKTVSNILNRLTADRILKYKIVGKNKEFFLNLENPLVRNYISIAETFKATSLLSKQASLKLLIEDFLENVEFEGALILFGSWAKGYATKSSDVDLMVVGKLKGEEAIRNLEQRHGIDINVHTFSKKQFAEGLMSEGLIKEAASGHVLLKNGDEVISILWQHFKKIK